MFRAWLSAHRSLVITATSGAVIAALVAAIAVVSTGYSAQKLDLTDGAVWVTNDSRQAIGRANTEVMELNSVVASTGTELDVLQSGSTVLLINRADSKIDIVSAATSQITDSVALPPDRPEVFLTETTVVILSQSSGEAWIVPLADLASFDAQTPATLSLGANTVASMDPSGQMYAYSSTAGIVYRLDPDSSDAVTSSQKVSVPASAGLSITSVAGTWAVLDALSRTVTMASRTVELGAEIIGTPVIQQASVSGEDILIASSDALMSVPIAGGSATALVTGQTGAPASPFEASGCAYAAWSGGSAWRQCATDPTGGVAMRLESMPATAQLAFRTNDAKVLLNDTKAGTSWAVQKSGQRINNWADLIPKDNDNHEETTSEDTPPEVDKAQLPPVAVDDDFGARPGRTTVLPILLNDYDPNGDVLTISQVTGDGGTTALVDVINNRQQLQVTLGDEATGSVTFGYTITDGRGGTASARVTVTVRQETENSPPRQVRASKSIVAASGRVTTEVLGDWVDPDGDPFYLTDATASDPDTASFKPSGTVVFTDSGTGTALKSVALVVSDGTDIGAGSLTITVKPAGKVPIIADPFIVLATAGQEVTIAPLEHVRGGTGAVRLNSVPARTGVTLTPSYDAGTFRFASDQITTHYIEYVVTDGTQTTTGLVRVDVIAPPDANAKPITIPKTVFVQTLRTERIDVAGTDIDPAGGVLLVTGISGLSALSGVSAEILEQRIVRVRLDSPLDGPVSFGYTVSNGLSESDGTITVIEIPAPTRMQPPVANDDAITVRVGAAIDIPVLNNDEHPDGEDLTLVPTLPVPLPDNAGLLFGSGKVLRYLAPDRPGNFSAVYEIRGPDGQSARARLKIAVREADAASNNPPVPTTLTARVLAGETVTVAVPLSGIDPDGDTVQLLGQETNPQKGSVVQVDGASITYRAGDYSAGTDSFTYTVIDALGARATGTVRVGITARLDGARNPVAILDEVTVRPGVTVSVRVLENDSDPDGSALTVVSAVPTSTNTKASVDGDLVSVTPPDTPGEYGVIYTIENAFGGTSSNFVRVTVDPKAPLAYPLARDTVLTLSDILDRTTLDVNVLSNVFFADGNPSELGLSVYPGFGSTAEVTADKRVRITVGDASQIIPFRVTHPDDPNVYSYAFIWVPGYNDALPQLNRNAPALSVISGDALTIELNSYVLAVGGGRVRITDTSTVEATHADGADLVVDSDTLVYTSADRYFGAASISFEVTDGSSASDPDGRKSILVLPITVQPRDNQPPVFQGAVLEFEPGQERAIDLTRLTTYPYPDDLGTLEYTVLNPLPKGFTYALDGRTLTLRANEQAVAGSSAAMSVGVSDGVSDGQTGRIQLSIVKSTKLLAQPAPDLAEVQRGETTEVDVLANDEATNPFTDEPLRVVAIRGIDGGVLPDGITVTPNASRSRLTVTASNDAEPTDISLQYQVADATGDPDRYVWGDIRIAVQDRPSPVTSVHVTEFADRKLTVAWNAGESNNSRITGYTVTLTSAKGAVVGTTDCSGSLCDVPTPGNGSEHGVRIAVSAVNSIGSSDATSNGTLVWSDVVPASPADLTSSPLDHGLKISWKKPADNGGGTAITKYVVVVEGVPTEEMAVPAGDPVGTVYSRNVTNPAIANGSNVSFSVSGRNQSLGSLANWNKANATGHPAGSPLREAAPEASAGTDNGSTATLAWPGTFSGNGRAVTEYFAAVFTGDAPTCTVTGDLPGTPVTPGNSNAFQHVGTATSASFTGLTADTTYSFAVYAFNGMGCTRSVLVEATPRARPGTVTAITTSGPEENGTATWDYRLTAVSSGGATDADNFRYRLSGGGVEGGEHGPASFGSFLEASNASQYGKKISVEVKACKDYPEVTLCSAAWSAPRTLGVPVRNSEPAGLAFTHDPFGTVIDPATQGSWTWSSSPQGAYESVTISCGGDDQTMTDGEGGACAVLDDGTIAHHFPDLTVTVAANGTEYVRTYVWTDYD